MLILEHREKKLDFFLAGGGFSDSENLLSFLQRNVTIWHLSQVAEADFLANFGAKIQKNGFFKKVNF